MMEQVKRLTESTEAFITRVSAYPRGRRAVAKEASEAVSTLEGIRQSGVYSDSFIEMLQKGM